ncbi:hypothetical protein LTR96_009365 [Exophiala xenobiotica]|nr:hypothetical protein LTR96_009365 [Exophiala xenobiotica]KAK5343880.1 hypothetical protein LTR98_001511 [Exophiala xenobiotica]
MASLSNVEYRIGWVGTLTEEIVAAGAMLDEDHGVIRGTGQDHNTYRAGRIHDHNVIIAVLPMGIDGNVSAASVVKDMIRTFGELRFVLLVGIGGGIPHLEGKIDTRLGDVVVSKPCEDHGGVIQYDRGKCIQGGSFERKGILGPPPNVLLTALCQLQVEHELNGSPQMSTYLTKAKEKRPGLKDKGYCSPPLRKDRLFMPTYRHLDGGRDCSACSAAEEIEREARLDTAPQIHYGIIASGEQVVKDPSVRDHLRKSYGALCVEMEAAGVLHNLPCLVIRGICDYADSHKNDDWHKYAAMTAAAYAKELLTYVSSGDVASVPPLQETLSVIRESFRPMIAHFKIDEDRRERKQQQRCHQAFKTTSYERQKNLNEDRAEGTCLWVLNNDQYLDWMQNRSSGLLWISADPGCGKSVLARLLVDHELQTTSTHTCCYYFFKDYEKRDSLHTALCAILHQLFRNQLFLIQHALPAWEANGEKISQEPDELWRILLAATDDQRSQNVTCILDALDEFQPHDRDLLIKKLSQFHLESSTPGVHLGRLRFLVTSRPYDDIEESFQEGQNESWPVIRLRGEDQSGEIGPEIDSVIRARVAKLATDISLTDEIRASLEKKLLEMKNRTYLWLSLSFGAFRAAFKNDLRPGERSIKTAIEELPKSVEDAYEKLLGKVTKDQVKVRKILSIVIAARSPLTVAEMALALGIATTEAATSLKEAILSEEHLKRNIREWCGLFVFFDKDKIYLVHQTAKEFLLFKGGRQLSDLPGWKGSLGSFATEALLLEICIKVLLLSKRGELYEVDDHDAQTALQRADKFVDYANIYWDDHLRCSDVDVSEICHPTLCKAYHLYDIDLDLLLWCGCSFTSAPGTEPSGVIDRRRQRLKDPRSVIQLASILGHHILLPLSSDGSRHPGLKVDMDKALWLASRQGWVKLVPVLIRSNPEIGPKLIRRNGDYLVVASENGHEDVVLALLDHGANANAPCPRYGGDIPLWYALLRRQTNIVDILLQHGANVCIVPYQRQYQKGMLAEKSFFRGHDAQSAVQAYVGALARALIYGSGGELGPLLDPLRSVAFPEAFPDVWDAALQLRGNLDRFCDETGERFPRGRPKADGSLERSLSLVRRVARSRWQELYTWLKFTEPHADEEFLSSLSADLVGCRRVIEDALLPQFEWLSPTLGRFRWPPEGSSKAWRYIKLGFMKSRGPSSWDAKSHESLLSKPADDTAQPEKSELQNIRWNEVDGFSRNTWHGSIMSDLAAMVYVMEFSYHVIFYMTVVLFILALAFRLLIRLLLFGRFVQ